MLVVRGRCSWCEVDARGANLILVVRARYSWCELDARGAKLDSCGAKSILVVRNSIRVVRSRSSWCERDSRGAKRQVRAPRAPAPRTTSVSLSHHERQLVAPRAPALAPRASAPRTTRVSPSHHERQSPRPTRVSFPPHACALAPLRCELIVLLTDRFDQLVVRREPIACDEMCRSQERLGILDRDGNLHLRQ